MYKDFEGQAVTIFASIKGGSPFQYKGVLKKADHVLILENASISLVREKVSSSVFGANSSFLTIEQDLPKVAINPDYVISIY